MGGKANKAVVLRVSRAVHVILRRTGRNGGSARSRHSDDTDGQLLRIHHVIGELPQPGYRRSMGAAAGEADLMVCLRSMPSVFTGSCAGMRCCLSEKPLYRHPETGTPAQKWRRSNPNDGAAESEFPSFRCDNGENTSHVHGGREVEAALERSLRAASTVKQYRT